jgi:CubicO group peptidase (beta-lactamase class C family)
MRVMRFLCTVLTSLAITAHVAAAEMPAAVDAFVKEEMEARGLPGVVVAILRDGAITEKAYGLANVELDVPLSTNQLFPIASATKPFTSMLILSFVRDEQLRLDDAVGQLLPDLPESWREVTVRQLLSHTSGLPDVSVSPGSAELIATTRDEAFAKLRVMPLQFPRGERWMYNQTNYALLQRIAEKISGKSIEAAMAERVFVPAGMTSVVYGDSDTLVHGRVSLYTRDQERGLVPRRLTFPQFLHTAAGVTTNARDLLAFLAHTGKLLPAPLLEQAWTASKLNDGTTFRLDKNTLGYGLGWVVNDADPKFVGHSGGGVAAMSWSPERRIGIVLLTNGQTNIDGMMAKLAAVVLAPSH